MTGMLYCGCKLDWEFVDCYHCQGSGEDYDMSGEGFCAYCSGSGEQKASFMNPGCSICTDEDEG